MATVTAIVALLAGLTQSALPAAADPVPPSTAATSTPGTTTAATGTTATAPVPVVQTADENSATAIAKSSGKAVPVDSATTPTSIEVANPDGTFTMTSNSNVVRAQTAAGWKPINTTLHANADGTVSAGQQSLPITFSGGGTAPLVNITTPTGSLAINWPNPLPAPTLSGSTATYLNVFPQVDLTVGATATGYTDVLVVHNAAAAANPALTSLQTTISTTGLSIKSNSDGSASIQNSTGTEVLHSPTPLMWDSQTSKVAGPASATDPGSGKQTTMTQQISPHLSAPNGPAPAGTNPTTTTETDTITPPAAALAGPGVTYPVYIDPTMAGGGQNFWIVVMQNGTPFSSTDPRGFNIRAGYCGPDLTPITNPCGGIGVNRAYIQFDASHITERSGVDATITSANIYINQIHSAADCATNPAEPTDLRSAGAIDANTTWANQPLGSVLDTERSNASENCGGSANMIFNGAAVTNYVSNVAAAGHPNITIALAAHDETDEYEWKQYSTSDSLSVTYYFPPGTPTLISVSHRIVCGGKTYTTDQLPTLSASASDNSGNIPAQAMDHFFTIHNASTGAQVWGNAAAVVVPSGATASVTKTGAGLGAGDWSFTDQVANGGLFGAIANPPYYFSTLTAPTATPTIASFNYPTDYWGGPTGLFVLTAGGASNIVAFNYSWIGGNPANPVGCETGPDSPGATSGTVHASGGSAVLTTPSTLTTGPHTLVIEAVDVAGDASPTASYSFYQSPNFNSGTTQYETTPNDGSSRTFAINNDNPPAGEISYAASGPATLWSEGYYDQLFATASGQSFTMSFNTTVEADYALGIQLAKGNHFGQLQFTLDGALLRNSYNTTNNGIQGDPIEFDGYSPTTTSIFQPLGGAHLKPGAHQIVVTVVGTNGASVSGSAFHYSDNGYSAGVDFFDAIPINNYTVNSFTAGKNNNGIATDNTATTANLDFANNNISGNHLSGLFPGGHLTVPANTSIPGVTVPAVTFSLPASNNGPNNNIIADRQSIPVAAPAAGRKVDSIQLLVVSTYGNTAHNNINWTPFFSLNVDDSTGAPVSAPYSDVLPSVPDWNNGTLTTPTTKPTPGTAYVTPAATMPGYDAGSNATYTTSARKLYVVTIPNTDPWPGDVIRSLTLPYLGTSFNTPHSNALHILDMQVHTIACPTGQATC